MSGLPQLAAGAMRCPNICVVCLLAPEPVSTLPLTTAVTCWKFAVLRSPFPNASRLWRLAGAKDGAAKAMQTGRYDRKAIKYVARHVVDDP